MEQYRKDIFLTFDMDWSIDEVLADYYALIKNAGVKATLNVTHQSKILEEFRRDSDFELGIHPNFVPGFSSGGGVDSTQIFGYLKRIVPEAVCSRSHALTTSSFLVAQYEKYGIQYDLNCLVEPVDGMCLLPYRAQVGEAMILPFIFEDDVYISRPERKPMSYYLGKSFGAPRIFNFHPQHLFLNTSSLDLYEQSKPYYKDYEQLQKFRNMSEPGVRDCFLELVALAKEKGYVFRTISEGNWQYAEASEIGGQA